jgi:hypothetical protein
LFRDVGARQSGRHRQRVYGGQKACTLSCSCPVPEHVPTSSPFLSKDQTTTCTEVNSRPSSSLDHSNSFGLSLFYLLVFSSKIQFRARPPVGGAARLVVAAGPLVHWPSTTLKADHYGCVVTMSSNRGTGVGDILGTPVQARPRVHGGPCLPPAVPSRRALVWYNVGRQGPWTPDSRWCVARWWSAQPRSATWRVAAGRGRLMVALSRAVAGPLDPDGGA